MHASPGIKNGKGHVGGSLSYLDTFFQLSLQGESLGIELGRAPVRDVVSFPAGQVCLSPVQAQEPAEI